MVTKIPGTPLPKATSPKVQRFTQDESTSTLSAYTTCLQFEQQLATTAQVRLVRILGYLLLYAPNRDVRSEVANCIHSCKEQSNLTDIGSFFEVYVITPLKKYKGRTPAPSDYSSRPSFEETKDTIIEAPKNHQDAKAQTLLRDNWCCVVSGTLHIDAPEDIILASDEETTMGSTETRIHRHVLDCSAHISAVLDRFHCDISTFTGEKVYSLVNAITMGKDVHDAFDRLELYFEATPVKNRYLVKSLTRRPLPLRIYDYVTFSTSNPRTLPVPSAELLALHATFCKVAKFSGSGEYIDAVYEDPEETGVLATDGTSHGFLRSKLLALKERRITDSSTADGTLPEETGRWIRPAIGPIYRQLSGDTADVNAGMDGDFIEITVSCKVALSTQQPKPSSILTTASMRRFALVLACLYGRIIHTKSSFWVEVKWAFHNAKILFHGTKFMVMMKGW
ncbi:hypothetical protein AGABI2DRAFT_115898 [Agaricus bisporus var. bisporus H97]|uniref:hypothetical protein n=1 Tax=Agaricus bisporus var. bisporus (strain H97 / ATCC MYA-4626 / FGSC 10389) TaxID=936046 RepID=UPI00029F7D4C|nr:hypothetical protein AGABI2DRAFT_115898 [Agaricus bisporus var. bisporus H97]EKV48845.1 hypothetical protein AGABI2DRAFT_115898 [Agaricus bisporus var. bisporus H97]